MADRFYKVTMKIHPEEHERNPDKALSFVRLSGEEVEHFAGDYYITMRVEGRDGELVVKEDSLCKYDISQIDGRVFDSIVEDQKRYDSRPMRIHSAMPSIMARMGF